MERTEESPISRTVVFAICCAVGLFGIHRLYVGRPFTAFLQLISCGGLGIWKIVDVFKIYKGTFTDGRGRPITQWEPDEQPSEHQRRRRDGSRPFAD